MAVALLKSQVIKYLPSLNTCTQTNKQTYKFIKIFLKILKNIRNMYDMEEEKSEIFIQGSLQGKSKKNKKNKKGNRMTFLLKMDRDQIIILYEQKCF